MIKIIMLTYNTESYVAEAIESVCKQNFPDWKLLIVNEGSTDHTPEIIEKYPSKPIMKVLVCEKRWNASRLELVIIRRESLQIRYTGPGITEASVKQKESAFPVQSLGDQA